ncbi:MAG: OmpL47-type beta-barrel domain-containing protein [Elusimicrobiota bacterium]
MDPPVPSAYAPADKHVFNPIPPPAPFDLAEISVTFDEELARGEMIVSGLSGPVSLGGGSTTVKMTGSPTMTLGPLSTYHVRTTAVDACGNSTTTAHAFSNGPLSIDFPSDPPDRHKGESLLVGGSTVFTNASVSISVGGVGGVVVTPSGGGYSATIPIPPDFEGDTPISVTASGDQGSASGTKDWWMDNRLTSVQVDDPADGTATFEESVKVKGSASDAKSGLASLLVGGRTVSLPPNTLSYSFDEPVKLQVGLNAIGASATDHMGNTKTDVVHVVRKAVKFGMGFKKRVLGCGGPGDWEIEVTGTPELVVQKRRTPGSTGWSGVGSIGAGGSVTYSEHAKIATEYKFEAIGRDPKTNKVLASASLTDSFPICRGDPTFLSQLPIFEQPSPGVPPEAFSPQASPGVADTYTRAYSAIFGATDVDIQITDGSGRLVRRVARENGMASGGYHFTWDGKDDARTFVPDGLYIVTLRENDTYDPSNVHTQSVNVTVDNALPLASMNRLEVHDSDPALIRVIGTAQDNNLRQFTVEYAPVSGGAFDVAGLGVSNVTQDILTVVDTTGWTPGDYTLKLAVTDRAGNVSEDTETLHVPAPRESALRLVVGGVSQEGRNAGGMAGPGDNPQTFLDDAPPAGVEVVGDWRWDSALKMSGSQSHTSENPVHYFIPSETPSSVPGEGSLLVKADESIIQYVYMSPGTQQIMLQFYTDRGNGDHRVYWGANILQTGGIEGTSSLYRMGDLPPAGRWVRLKIPAAAIKLEGKTIKGILFGAHGGRVWWDKTTTSNSTMDPGPGGFSLPEGFQGDDSTDTTVEFSLAKAAGLTLEVLNEGGSTVRTLLSQPLPAGTRVAVWDQKDDGGSLLPDGLYYFQFKAHDGVLDTEQFAADVAFSTTTPFPEPSSASVTDANGNVYAAVPEEGIIEKRTAEGYLLRRISNDELRIPNGPAVPDPAYLSLDDAGNLYVSGADRGQVIKLAAGRRLIDVRSLTADIRIPWPKALVRATVPIFGTAAGHEFLDYAVEVGQGWSPETWSLLNRSQSEVLDDGDFPPGQTTVYGNLATWETGLSPGDEYPEVDIFHPPVDLGYRGRWTVRLSVRSRDGFVKSSTVPVIVARVVNNLTGGVVPADLGRGRLIVPALALEKEWELFAMLSGDQEAPAAPSTHDLVGRVYEVLPGGYDFRRPVSLELGYGPMDLDKDGDGIADIFESRLGIYRYNPETKRWVFLGGVRREEISEGDLTAGWVRLDGTQKLDAPNAFYALMAWRDKPMPPVVHAPASPSDRRIITFTGRAEPGADVLFFRNPASPAFSEAAVRADDQGSFWVPGVVLTTGTNVFQAVQRADAAEHQTGIRSDPSVPVTVEVATRPAPSPAALEFRNADFREPKRDDFLPGATVYIEARAQDADPTRRDEVYVRLKSSVSDPAGLLVPLTEIGLSSAVYRGTARLGLRTDQTFFQLAALRHGERIIVEAESDPSVTALLHFRDHNSPFPQAVMYITHPSARQETFERDAGLWAAYDALGGAEVTRTSATAASGLWAMKLTQPAGRSAGNFSVLIHDQPFDARQFPVVGFDYRLPPSCQVNGRPLGARFNLFFLTGGTWNEVVFTDPHEAVINGQKVAFELPKDFPPSIRRVGDVFDEVTADDTWRRAEFNLFAFLRKANPEAERFLVDRVIMGDWDAQQFFGLLSGGTPPGATVYLDNFHIQTAGDRDPHPLFVWGGAGDETGFSHALDRNPGTLPDAFPDTVQPSASYLNLADGVHYFHVRGLRDVHAGTPNHYRIRLDRAAPVASDPSPAAGSRSDSLEAAVTLSDGPEGSGLDPDSVRFAVNGVSYGPQPGAVSYDERTGKLTVSLGKIKPAAPAFFDGQLVTFTLEDAADWAGNSLASPFSWTWQADFSRFAGGDFAPATFNGGREPAWSPASDKIAFVSDRGGQADLYVVGAAGESASPAVRLTSSTAAESRPDWSPDGNWVAFAAPPAEEPAGRPDVWIVNVHDGRMARLTANPAADEHPSWSPDGGKIVFSRSESGLGNLWVLEVDTHTLTASETRLTFEDVGYNLEPAWSRDGSRIAYRRSLYVDNIFAVNADGSGARALTDSRKDSLPSWDASGRLAFSSRRSADVPGLWAMEGSGDNQRVLLDNNNLWPDSDPAWAPDGTRLAFTSTRGGAANVWVMSVLEVSGVAASPDSFSPNGDGRKDETVLSYSLSTGDSTVSAAVFDESGNKARTLLQGQLQAAGAHAAVWDGRTDAAAPAAPGLYRMRLEVRGKAAVDDIVKEVRVLLDDAAPETSLTAASADPARGPGSAPYFNGAARFGFSAAEPAGKPASGVELSEYSLDGGVTWSVFDNAFALAPGTHTILYRSLDAAGNLEAAEAQEALVENDPPVSALSIHGPLFVSGGTTFISRRTSFTLTAADVFSDGVVSGLREVFLSRDNGPEKSFGGPAEGFHVSTAAFDGEGNHALTYRSVDRSGNGEAARTFSAFLDGAGPSVSASFDPPALFNGVSRYVTPETRISFPASDAASGVGRVAAEIDGGEVSPAADGTLQIASEGPHDLTFWAVDNVENESARQSVSLIVSAAPPTTIFNASGTLHAGGTGVYAPPSNVYWLSTAPGAPAPDGYEIAVDGAEFAAFAATETLSLPGEGSHAVAFRALRGGIPEASDTFRVIVDATPPSTVDSRGEGSAVLDGRVYATPRAPITLSAEDVLAGVKATKFVVDGTTFSYAAPFTLEAVGAGADGARVLSWSSEDNVGNVEESRSLEIVVDGAAPSSRVSAAGATFLSGSRLYAAGSVVYSISASDAGAGVRKTEYRTAGGAFQVLAASETFALAEEGSQDIVYRSEDYVGNVEAEKTFRVVVDTSPPTVRIEALGEFLPGATSYARAGTPFAVTAPDSLSGLAFAEMSLDGGSFQAVGGLFTLDVEGLHSIEARAADRVGNASSARLWVAVDEAPPVTEAASGEPSVRRGSVTFVTSLTFISLDARDPEANGLPGAGVRETRYRVDSGALVKYDGAFRLASGGRAVGYFSSDRVSNVEPSRAAQFTVDDDPPVTALNLSETGFSNGVNLYVSTGAIFSLEAADAGVGLAAIEISMDGGDFAPYAGPFSLETEGPRVLAYRSRDELGNVEAVRSLSVIVDNTPPSVALSVDGTLHAGVDGRRFAPASNVYSLSAAAPSVVSIQAGVDGGAFAPYAGPVSFVSEGRHTLAFFGETAEGPEDAEIFEVWVDTTPPFLSLEPDAGFWARPGGGPLYVSTATRLLAAARDDAGSADAGLDRVHFALNAGTPLVLAVSSSVENAPLPIVLGPGVHTVRLTARDHVGNVGERSRAVELDNAPPRTVLSLSGSSLFLNGVHHLPASALFTLTSTDAASGVERIEYRLNGGPFFAYQDAFPSLGDGAHSLDYRAVDQVGNAEPLKSFSFVTDARAPVVTVKASGPLVARGTQTFAALANTYSLSGTDAGVGLRQIEYETDGSGLRVYAHQPAAFASGGPHALRHTAVDHVGNRAPLIEFSVYVDTTPPVTDLSADAGHFMPERNEVVVSSRSVLSLAAWDEHAGVERILARVDGSAYEAAPATRTFRFSEGTHTLAHFGEDAVGNVEAARVWTVRVDNDPPAAPVGFAVRLSGDAAALTWAASLEEDVAGYLVFRDGVVISTVSPSRTSFTDAGLPRARFHYSLAAVDRVGNSSPHSPAVSVLVGNPPPVAEITSPAEGDVLAGAATVRGTAAAELFHEYVVEASAGSAPPVFTEVARSTAPVVDGPLAAWETSAFPEGPALLRLTAYNTALEAATATISVTVDRTAPALTGFSVDPSPAPLGPATLRLDVSEALTASPEVYVEGLRLEELSGEETSFLYRFHVTTATPQGRVSVETRLVDRAGHVTVATAAFTVDRIPPGDVTDLAASPDHLNGEIRLSWTAPGDDEWDGNLSGSYRVFSSTTLPVDENAYTVLTASAPAATPASYVFNGLAYDATHYFLLRTEDDAGNLSGPSNMAAAYLISDREPPITEIVLAGSVFVEGDKTFLSGATAVSLTATDEGNVPSGVARTEYRVDGGSFTVYAASFTLAQGVRVVEYQSFDRAGNAEPVRSAVFHVDAVPPAVSLGIGEPQHMSAGDLYVSRRTPFSLSADDLSMDGVSSGARDIFFRSGPDVSAPFEIYQGTFTLDVPEGGRTIAYYGEDRVDNAGAPAAAAVVLDATPPATDLVVEGPRAVAGLDTYVSTRTVLALKTSDPLVNGAASGAARAELRLNGGAFETYSSSFTLSEGVHILEFRSEDNVANREPDRLSELRADGTAPQTSLVLTGPSHDAGPLWFAAENTLIGLEAVDPVSSGTASGVAASLVQVNAGPLQDFTTGFLLAEGVHALRFYSRDRVDNIEAVQEMAVAVDATPPATGLAVGFPKTIRPGAPLLIGPQTPLSLTSSDPVVNGAASGVAASRYRLGAGPFALYGGPFTLPGPSGLQTVAFYSEDRVGHAEPVQTETLELDATPPALVLVSPSTSNAGVCLVFSSGTIPILGSASDPHFARYTVSFATAAGRVLHSAGPFTEIASSTHAVVSGALAAWDATGRTGWHTLRVEAQDIVENTAALQMNIFIGPPIKSLGIGKNEPVNFELKDPQGVAVDSAGNIYVGEKGMLLLAKPGIRKFSPSGVLLATFDDPVLNLGEPSGLAVDAGGNIYVADRANHQVLKLGPQGQKLFVLGKTGLLGWPAAGAGPGEFNEPTGVALDGEGNIYVADHGNARLQKFTSAGQFLATLNVGSLASPASPSDPSRPWGVAADAASLWITDSRYHRVLRLSPAGQLLAVSGGAGSGSYQDPRGIDVNAQGYVVVADMGNVRVQKLDPGLNPVLTLPLGTKGLVGLLNTGEPVGVALGPDGRLHVTDMKRDTLHVFDAPADTSAPQTAAAPSAASIARPAPSGPDPAFRLGEVYAFPNPVKGRRRPVIHVETGVADGVEIRIYDLAGLLIHEARVSGPPVIVDDGQGPQYAFEYEWNISHHASGVYICGVRAHKEGHEDLRAVIKLGVIK